MALYGMKDGKWQELKGETYGKRGKVENPVVLDGATTNTGPFSPGYLRPIPKHPVEIWGFQGIGIAARIEAIASAESRMRAMWGVEPLG